MASSQNTHDNNSGSAPPGRSLFGRRIGRPLSPQKREILDRLLPALSVPADRLNKPNALNPETLFTKKLSSFWLEIGFGHGEHLATLARNNPDIGYLGAEPFLNGMAAFLCGMAACPLENVRVLMDDAMLMARALTDESLDGIFILNPDPWHKTRHHKRRIVNKANLDTFHRILKPGGALIMTSDVEAMTEWMVTQAINHPGFEWTAKGAKDWENPPPGWITTRYETKGAKNAKKMSYLLFQKKP